MKTVASWAHAHPYYSRLFIVLAHLVLIGIAFFWGISLYLSGILLPAYISLFLGISWVAAALYYPSSPVAFRGRIKAFRLRRTCDTILVFSTLLLVTSLSNRIVHEPALPTPIVRQTSEKTSLKTLHKQQKKWVRKQIRKQILPLIKAQRQQSNTGEFGRTIGIIFSILAALFLSLLIIGLSCSLSCSGSGALGVIVLLLGQFLIIFLLVKIIRKIQSKATPYTKDIEIDERDPDKHLYFQ